MAKKKEIKKVSPEERTQELIAACKEAGYKHLVVFCSNENVPESVEAEERGTYWMGGGNNFPRKPHLICASPPQLDADGQPKMWGIVKGMKLNFRGAGWGDCYPVEPALHDDVNMGYYNLTD